MLNLVGCIIGGATRINYIKLADPAYNLGISGHGSHFKLVTEDTSCHNIAKTKCSGEVATNSQNTPVETWTVGLTMKSQNIPVETQAIVQFVLTNMLKLCFVWAGVGILMVLVIV